MNQRTIWQHKLSECRGSLEDLLRKFCPEPRAITDSCGQTTLHKGRVRTKTFVAVASDHIEISCQELRQPPMEVLKTFWVQGSDLL